MRIGLTVADIAGVDAAAAAGVDFIEAKGDALVGTGADGYWARLATCGRPVQTLTSPLPRALGYRLIGPDAELDPAMAVIVGLVKRLAPLGLRTVNFGCGQARRAPEGTDPATAKAELAAVLTRLAVELARFGVSVAVEPLAQCETNTVNRAAEGVELLHDLAMSGIGLTIDLWQCALEGLDIGAEVAVSEPYLRHVQTADPHDRGLPTADLEAQQPLLWALARAKYSGPVAIECDAVDLDIDDLRSLARAFRQAGPSP